MSQLNVPKINNNITLSFRLLKLNAVAIDDTISDLKNQPLNKMTFIKPKTNYLLLIDYNLVNW